MPGGRADPGTHLQRLGRAARRTRQDFDPTRGWPIHRQPPPFDEVEPQKEIFVTGIKVIDLISRTSRAGRSGCSVAPGSVRR